MSDNPYQAPAAVPEIPASEGRTARPLGVAILAVLHVLGGALLAAIGVYLAMGIAARGRNLASEWLAVVMATVGPVLAILSMAVAVGLWRASKWAWWLATLYYFQFALGGVVMLVIIAVGYVFFDRPLTPRTGELVVKHVVRGAFFAALTWYMLRRSVFDYFQFQRLTRLRALAILSGAVILTGSLLALGLAMALWG
jgi:hypothetical protein